MFCQSKENYISTDEINIDTMNRQKDEYNKQLNHIINAFKNTTQTKITYNGNLNADVINELMKQGYNIGCTLGGDEICFTITKTSI